MTWLTWYVPSPKTIRPLCPQFRNAERMAAVSSLPLPAEGTLHNFSASLGSMGTSAANRRYGSTNIKTATIHMVRHPFLSTLLQMDTAITNKKGKKNRGSWVSYSLRCYVDRYYSKLNKFPTNLNLEFGETSLEHRRQNFKLSHSVMQVVIKSTNQETPNRVAGK